MTEYGKLLRQSSIAIAICLVAVLVCYFWIDRPVAFFVHRDHFNEITAFRWLTYPPPEVQTWSPLVLAMLAVRRALGPLSRCQKVLLVACASLIVTDQFRVCLGDIFGRYWPETWSNNNPSLIGDGTYGFHPFERGDDLGSFPSGHAARILSFAPRVVHEYAAYSGRQRGCFSGDVAKSCFDELPFCGRRNCRRFLRRNHRRLRGALGETPDYT